MPRGNRKNLIPASERSKDEAINNGKKGGVKSGEVRRANRERRIRLKELSELEVNKTELPEKFHAVDGKFDHATLIDFALMKKCSAGNVNALKLYYDIMQTNPLVKSKVDETNLRLQLMKLNIEKFKQSLEVMHSESEPNELEKYTLDELEKMLEFLEKPT